MSDALVLYTYASCDTCRKAVKWLRARDIAFTEKAIRETPPTAAELESMLRFQDGELKRLFNTAGRDYRALGLAKKWPTLTKTEAIVLLTKNGNLVKRPFALSKKVGLVGFNEAEWENTFEKP